VSPELTGAPSCKPLAIAKRQRDLFEVIRACERADLVGEYLNSAQMVILING
jgi:hypothetical protein